MWFKTLTGFEEISPEHVRENLYMDGIHLVSRVNKHSFQAGTLQTPTLAELKQLAPPLEMYNGQIKVSEVIADVRHLHCNPENKSALFQVASQFNLLEMVNPDITPESGVDIYEYDKTQGPACAIACGAGTIYRNYFANVRGRVGQTSDNQIDCLDALAIEMKNDILRLWKMSNGYALATKEGLSHIQSILVQATDEYREILKSKIRIGIQWDTEVTISHQKQIVSQAYCSALPVAYSNIGSVHWEPFARLVLEAAYEATFYAGLINMHKTGSPKVFLTMLGGGAFGNEMSWIIESISGIIKKFKNIPLDIIFVSYGKPNPMIRQLLLPIHS